MKFFNIDLHISVIEDIKLILQDLGHQVDSVNMSGHTWVFGRRSSDGFGPVTRGTIHSVTPEQFYRECGYALDEYDGFICCYPPSLSRIFEPFGKPIIASLPIRYERAYSNDARAWSALNDFFRRTCGSGQTAAVANSQYDQKYFEHFTGVRPAWIQSLCGYVGRASYDPAFDTALIAGTRSDEAVSECQAAVPSARSLKRVYPKYQFQDLARHKAIIHLPYNASVMSFFEQYLMNIPLFVPSPTFLLELMERVDLLSELTWNQCFCLGRSGSVIPGVGELPDPNDYANPSAVARWMEFYDFYTFPHVTRFDSFADLSAQLDGLDLGAISLRMAAENARRRVRIAQEWDGVVKGLDGWHRGTRPVKGPVPGDAERVANDAAVRDLPELAASDRPSRRALGRALIERADKEIDRGLAFSLLRKASAVSAAAMDFDAATAAVRRLERRFDFEAHGAGGRAATFSVDLRKELLSEARDAVQSPEDARAFASEAAKLVDRCAAEDLYDAAVAVSRLACDVAERSGPSVLALACRRNLRVHEETRLAYEAVASAHRRVLHDPDDPEACGAWGNFLLFVKSEGGRGLRFLAKGSDGALRSVAEKELRKAPEGESAADWLVLSERAPEPERGRYLRRARRLLESSLASLAGAEASEAQRRIEAIDDSMGVVNLLRLVDPRTDFFRGRPSSRAEPPRFEGGKLLMQADFYDWIEVPFVPPPEYDLTVVAQRPSGGHPLYMVLSDGRHRWCAAFGGWFGKSGILNVDGCPAGLDEDALRACKLSDGPNSVGTFDYSVRGAGFNCSFDGKPILDWSGDRARLSLPPQIRPTREGVLCLAGVEGRHIIHRMSLVPVSGEGRKLR